MTPTYEEMLTGSTNWRFTHKGLSYSLNHHGYRKGGEAEVWDDSHPGTWCYYLLVPEQMYPHRWPDFAVTRKESGYCDFGPAFTHDMFDTEITWQSSEPYFDRKTGRVWDGAKVGCDYNHSWHRDMGYPDTFESVKRDATNTVDKFLSANPDFMLRCAWSGQWDEASKFYKANNGSMVHVSLETELGNRLWHRAE